MIRFHRREEATANEHARRTQRRQTNGTRFPLDIVQDRATRNPCGRVREELCDALQVNGMGHELTVFDDADHLFEVIEAESVNRNAKNGRLPNLLMIASAGGSKSTVDILTRLKLTPTIKAIPVIVFCAHDTASNTPQLYQLGAASVIRMPLQFNGLIEIIRVMEDYWFKVSSPPPV